MKGGSVGGGGKWTGRSEFVSVPERKSSPRSAMATRDDLIVYTLLCLIAQKEK